MRFYNADGIEMDVQDPKFFIDEERYKAIAQSIDEMLSDASCINPTAHCHGAHSESAKSRYINCSWGC